LTEQKGFEIRIPHPGCSGRGADQVNPVVEHVGIPPEKLPGFMEIKADGSLIVRRDRMGLNTVRFAQTEENSLLFSDSILLLAGRLGRVTLDRTSLCEHLTYRYVSGTRTLFREISSVPAGYRVVFTPDGGSGWFSRLERDSAFDWGAQNRPAAFDTSRAFEALLTEIVGRLSEGCGYIFFSGRLDSALVASACPEAPRAITAGTEDKAFDECPRAELAAGQMGLRWAGARMSGKVFLETLRRAVSSSCGTLPVEQLVSYRMLLDRFAPEGPVLSGYGADFLFGEGQRKYWVVLRIGKLLGATVMKLCLDAYGMSGGRQRQQARTAGLFLKRRTDGDTWVDMMPVLDPPCDPAIARMALDLETLPDYHEHRRRMLVDEMPPHLTQKVFVTYSNLIADTVSSWSRMLSAAGCELRLPFLSDEMIDFVCGLDPRSYLGVFSRKPIIRDLAARRLPSGILRLPKMSGTLPVWKWISTPGGGFEDLLESLGNRGIVDLAPLRDSTRKYERYGYLPLWAAVNLELLLEELEQAGVRVEGS